jgi:hypothetical protein
MKRRIVSICRDAPFEVRGICDDGKGSPCVGMDMDSLFDMIVNNDNGSPFF